MRAETIDRVLAVVAGDFITLSDVNAATELGLVTPRDAADPIRDVLSQFIDRELELAEVERYAQPEPTAEAVDNAVQMVRARFATTQAFAAVLLRSGIDEQHLRGTLRENLRIRAYLDQRFATSAAAAAAAHRRVARGLAAARRDPRRLRGQPLTRQRPTAIT